MTGPGGPRSHRANPFALTESGSARARRAWRQEFATRVAFVSTYPPRHCGIATFTADLAGAVGGGCVAALHYAGDPDAYPAEVTLRIRRDEPEEYARAAWAIDRSHVDVVSVQHEYGIWGGRDGELVLDFVRAIHKPVVTTLHTVPQWPSAGQLRILVELLRLSAATVVMSRSAAALLRRIYDVDDRTLDVVAHGVPDLPLVDPDTVKPELGLEIRPTILSFGLIGPGKGYESVIEAMPEVVRGEPRALYVILGATHPELLRREGEAYRSRLARLAEGLGVDDRVRFVDRYVSQQELGRWLGAADIFVTPYPNPDQIVSGTLSYAMGAGKAIVSTPYAYAREMLDSGVGLLVPPGSPKALAEALVGLLRDDEARRALGRLAYERGRAMIWPHVGRQYQLIFGRVAAAGPVRRLGGRARAVPAPRMRRVSAPRVRAVSAPAVAPPARPAVAPPARPAASSRPAPPSPSPVRVGVEPVPPSEPLRVVSGSRPAGRTGDG
jgi:glycosyltransferase involved in cell wall biosynthesis